MDQTRSEGVKYISQLFHLKEKSFYLEINFLKVSFILTIRKSFVCWVDWAVFCKQKGQLTIEKRQQRMNCGKVGGVVTKRTVKDI